MIQFYCDKDLPFFELKSCNTSELSYKKHAHEEYSIGIVNQGRSIFWYEGEFEEIGPNTMVFLPHDLVHSCNPINQNMWEYKMIYINKSWLQGLAKSNNNRSFNAIVIKDVSDRKNCFLVNKMLESLQSNASPLEKETNIVTVFEQSLVGEKKKVEINKKEYTRLTIIQDYLQSCFAEKITLDQLEAASGLNKFHIIRLFKKAFKMPPHAYQTLLRINYAKKELRRNRPLLEVAYKSGFYDQSHFIKVFKYYTGTTPDRYQKNLLN